MNDKQHTNINSNSLTISTLHNLNNMNRTQVADNQQINTFENIDSIVWFGLNYTNDFIDQCWSGDKCLANHLKDKFSICTEGLYKMSNENTRIGYGVFTRFITMLDSANREKLYNYIINLK